MSRNRINMVGEVYGRLTVVEYAHTVKNISKWRCRCECGNYTVQTRTNLRTGRVFSCGCLRRDKGGKTKYEDYVGYEHKGTTVLARGPYVPGPAGVITTQWLCRCSCGNKFTMTSLQLGFRASKHDCGCKGHKFRKPGVDC